MPKKKPEKDRYVTKAEFGKAMAIVNKSFDHVATKQQLQIVVDDVAVLKDDVAVLKDDMKTVKSSLESILNVVSSIDAQLNEHRDLPRRVSNLEEDMFKTKLEIRRRK